MIDRVAFRATSDSETYFSEAPLTTHKLIASVGMYFQLENYITDHLEQLIQVSLILATSEI